jgi:hypothetical protein
VGKMRVIACALVIGILAAGPTPAYAKSPKPTLAQIQAAKQAESAKRVAANVAVTKLKLFTLWRPHRMLLGAGT